MKHLILKRRKFKEEGAGWKVEKWKNGIFDSE